MRWCYFSLTVWNVFLFLRCDWFLVADYVSEEKINVDGVDDFLSVIDHQDMKCRIVITLTLFNWSGFMSFYHWKKIDVAIILKSLYFKISIFLYIFSFICFLCFIKNIKFHVWLSLLILKCSDDDSAIQIVPRQRQDENPLKKSDITSLKKWDGATFLWPFEMYFCS